VSIRKLHKGGGAGIRFSVTAKDFLFYIVSRPAMGLTQPPVQSVPAAVSWEAKLTVVKLASNIYC
jgi:hypothetical protein